MNNFTAMTFRFHTLRQQFDDLQIALAQFPHSNSSNGVWAHTIVRLLALARRNWRKAVPIWYHFAKFIAEPSFGIPPFKNKARRDQQLPKPRRAWNSWRLLIKKSKIPILPASSR
jgi:hypothetical protein